MLPCAVLSWAPHRLWRRSYPYYERSLGKVAGPALSAGAGLAFCKLLEKLEQLDIHKQAGQWARLYKQVQAAEARLSQAEQDTPLTQTSPSEFAKQQEALVSERGATPSSAEITEAGERQAQLRAIASGLLYWKGGLKLLRQAKLPKWRGFFKWQIEAKIEALQAEYATLRAEAAKSDR